MLAEQTLAPATGEVLINLPADQYRHPGAPTEWWWHIGTLRTDDGRAFGFEINAVGVLTDKTNFGVAMGSITDVTAQQHYSALQYLPLDDNWAEADPTKPWRVGLNSPVGYPDAVTIAMNGIDGSVDHMTVRCDFTSKASGKKCSLSLRLEQQGPPLYVFGTGRTAEKIGDGPLPVQQYNFYYSYTNLKATGTITVDGETFGVQGTTWMDHEYGVFSRKDGGPVQWMLQDLQLDNGLHLSNYVIVKPGETFQEGVPVASHATMLVGGKSEYVATRTTPMKPAVVNGETYFMQFRVDLLSEGRETVYFIVDSACTDQVFKDPTGLNAGYEGNGRGRMLLDLDRPDGGNTPVLLADGDAWIEEMLYTKIPGQMSF